MPQACPELSLTLAYHWASPQFLPSGAAGASSLGPSDLWAHLFAIIPPAPEYPAPENWISP